MYKMIFEEKMKPKVFVSHASEDKDRFVREFGVLLRRNGVDAWVDEWEIKAGESFVRKIYDDGIKNAQAFIIVLSKISVEKPWVREELDAAVVKRIQNGTKIIPVILDDCKVPEALSTLFWVKVEDLNNYDIAFNKIIKSIFEYSDKPPLGEPPVYTRKVVDSLPGLAKFDVMLLKIIGESAMQIDGFISVDNVEKHAVIQGISHQDLIDSLDVLDEGHYINLLKTIGVPPSSLSLEYRGFDLYSTTFVSGYASIRKEVIAQIVNHEQKQEGFIAASINQPVNLVRHIMSWLKLDGYIKVTETFGVDNRMYVYEVSPRLKRFLESS
jgi:hypothetical protein